MLMFAPAAEPPPFVESSATAALIGTGPLMAIAPAAVLVLVGRAVEVAAVQVKGPRGVVPPMEPEREMVLVPALRVKLPVPLV